jgi:DNA polymerase elongation subunit (family B)
VYNVTDQEYKDYLSELDIDSLYAELSEIESETTRQLSWDLFTRYNVVDALLVKQLDDKLNLIRIVVTVAYKAGINFEDVSSPIKTWDSIIHNTLLDEKVVVPQATRSRVQPLDGAYVREPVPGRYKNVSSIDATSLN